ncbi:MAG: malonic semialdehyde reductase [Erythrobacter sp.]
MTKQFHDNVLDSAALDQLFNNARSYNDWHDKPISDEQIQKIHALLKMAPTSANMQPARFVWCTSQEAKDRLAVHAMDANKPKVQKASACVIIGYDVNFHEQLPWLFPHTDAKSWFDGDEAGRIDGARRNSALQGAYLMLAARAVGLDCGPMSGVDLDAVTKEFFTDQPNVQADWICSIGYGDPASIFERSPRPDFEKFNAVI